MVGADLAYLLCVLNSPLSEWFFSKVGTTTGVGTVRWKKYTIGELLIPHIDNTLRITVKSLVDQYVANDITVTQLSIQANTMLYKSIGLTDAEIDYVENFYPPLL